MVLKSWKSQSKKFITKCFIIQTMLLFCLQLFLTHMSRPGIELTTELHQTGTFEGRSTDWATRPRHELMLLKKSYIFCRTNRWAWCWPSSPSPSSGSTGRRSPLARPEDRCSKGWDRCTSSRTEGWTSGLWARCRSSIGLCSHRGPHIRLSAHQDILEHLAPNLDQWWKHCSASLVYPLLPMFCCLSIFSTKLRLHRGTK